MNSQIDVPVTVSLRFPKGLLDRIDAIIEKLDMSRSQYVRRLAREAVDRDGVGLKSTTMNDSDILGPQARVAIEPEKLEWPK